jgi:peptidoglycan/LPS O-acetylase OafA/YrhL
LPMCLGIVLSLLVSWVFLRLYDEPLRNWMARRSRSKRVLGASVSVS